MLPKTRKRKHRPRHHASFEASGNTNASGRADTLPQPDPALWIQAHEADIIRGPRAAPAAESLEVQYDGDGKLVSVGDGLIRWKAVQSESETGPSTSFADDSFLLGHPDPDRDRGSEGTRDKLDGVWVDRYDARLLLEALPIVHPNANALLEPGSPTGWSDLPSDTEDVFFLSPEEVDDLRRDKRRRLMDRIREERVKALQEEQGEEERKEEDEWGGSDEEPDDQQAQLMQRTAAHILSSPNPAQLEMRILANHGADSRFAFLRGRWPRAWKMTKTRIRIEGEKAKAKDAKQTNVVALGGLAGYGDSGTESDESGGEVPPAAPDSGDSLVAAADTSVSSYVAVDDAEDEAKRARRARAKEWAEKRRAERATHPECGDDDP